MKIVYKAFEQLPVLGAGQITLKEIGRFTADYDESGEFMKNEFKELDVMIKDINEFYERHKDEDLVTLYPKSPENLIILPIIQK